MKYQKGQSGNPNGRPKGSRNKLRANLVEEIISIAEELEDKGVGLRACANENPSWFLEQFVKPIIPKNVDLNLDGDMRITWEK
jgi:hypothetical protein